jgi:cbb3-type cytochrome oxidase subunit 1
MLDSGDGRGTRGSHFGHTLLYVALLIVGFAIGVIVAAYLFWPLMALAALLPVPDGRPRESAAAIAYFIWMLIPFGIAHVFSLTLFREVTKPTDDK